MHLVALDGFHLMLSTQLTANLTLEWSGGSMFHPLSHIYVKTIFCCIETVSNNALNCWHVIVFDWLWTNMNPLWTQLSHWQIIMQNSEYTAFWYFQLICYLMQLQYMIDQNKFVEFFSVFQNNNCWIWVTRASTSFASVWPRLKSAYHLLTIASDRAESK